MVNMEGKRGDFGLKEALIILLFLLLLFFLGKIVMDIMNKGLG
jgi:hypothetical protein